VSPREIWMLWREEKCLDSGVGGVKPKFLRHPTCSSLVTTPTELSWFRSIVGLINKIFQTTFKVGTPILNFTQLYAGLLEKNKQMGTYNLLIM
jgi:hypothetical protein